MTRLEKLTSICRPIGTVLTGVALDDQHPLFELRPGFVGFESALLILPAEPVASVPGTTEWNDPSGWKRHYGPALERVEFFALDAFACQYGLSEAGVVRFEPEAGVLKVHSTDLEDWAAKILADYNLETGWSVAREWQVTNRPLTLFERLLPKRPFVLGGEYAADNLVAMPCVDLMERVGELYSQIRDLPDGASITLKGWLD